MSFYLFEIVHNSMNNLFDRLIKSPQIEASPELKSLVANLHLLHQEQLSNINNALKENEKISGELRKRTRDPNEIIDEDNIGFIDQYQKIRNAGGTAALIYRVAIADGTDHLVVRRILYRLFSDNLEQVDQLFNTKQIP